MTFYKVPLNLSLYGDYVTSIDNIKPIPNHIVDETTKTVGTSADYSGTTAPTTIPIHEIEITAESEIDRTVRVRRVSPQYYIHIVFRGTFTPPTGAIEQKTSDRIENSLAQAATGVGALFLASTLSKTGLSTAQYAGIKSAMNTAGKTMIKSNPWIRGGLLLLSGIEMMKAFKPVGKVTSQARGGDVKGKLVMKMTSENKNITKDFDVENPKEYTNNIFKPEITSNDMNQMQTAQDIRTLNLASEERSASIEEELKILSTIEWYNKEYSPAKTNKIISNIANQVSTGLLETLKDLIMTIGNKTESEAKNKIKEDMGGDSFSKWITMVQLLIETMYQTIKIWKEEKLDELKNECCIEKKLAKEVAEKIIKITTVMVDASNTTLQEMDQVDPA